MKNKGGGARKSGQGQRQGAHCSHQNLGQGRGLHCEYRRSQKGAGLPPVRSIISSVLLGIQRLAQNSQQKIAMLSRKSELLSHTSSESGPPSLEFRPRENAVKQLEEKTTTDNER